MKRQCSLCGKTDHRASNRSIHPTPGVAVTKACGYCHRTGGSHSERCKRATGKGARAKPTGPPDLPTNGVRETARTLLGQLEALKAKLAARIEAVKELTEIL